MRVDADAIRSLGPQEVLLGIVEDARSIPIAEYENEPAETLRRELVPEVQALAHNTLQVLNPLVDPELVDDAVGHGHQVPTARAFARRVDELIRSVDTVDHLGNLAFLARGELRCKLRLLGETDELDSWELIERAGSTVRKVVKTATALDLVLGDCTGIHHLDFETELETSLQVRRVYGKFRRHLVDFEPQEGGGPRLEQLLNNAATAIARLIGRDVYLDLRVADRVELRKLQRRLIDWIVEARHDGRAGQRLLEDIRAFVELLNQVNHRQELREHDRKLVCALHVELDRETTAEPGPADLRGRLDRLFGLDEELDQELRRATEMPTHRLQTILARLSASYQVPSW